MITLLTAMVVRQGDFYMGDEGGCVVWVDGETITGWRWN